MTLRPGAPESVIQSARRPRRAELSRAIYFVSHEMPLTAHNLRVVLICGLVLYDRYVAESAA
jgi:hypothetical protein